jgi:hypothetical protein
MEHCSPECEARDAAAVLTSEERDRAEYLAGQRHPESLIAWALGLTPQAWGRVKKGDPRAREALSRGRARELRALVDALFLEATEGGNVQAAMFLLKTRHGFVDRPEPEAARVRVEIQLPAALSEEQYRQLREVVSPRRQVKDVTPPRIAAASEGAST